MDRQSAQNKGPSEDAIYSAIAARRAQFDSLVWQVPVLSLTAQAFLFTIALGSDTSRYARTIACLLSVLTSFLTVHLLTRHRQAEIIDAHWLAALEDLSSLPGAHGAEWRTRRDNQNANAGIFEPLSRLPGFKTWSFGALPFRVGRRRHPRSHLAGSELAGLTLKDCNHRSWKVPRWVSPVARCQL